MSKRKLYPTLSKKNNLSSKVSKMMDFLQYCDGKSSLKKISKYIYLNLKNTKKIYLTLKDKNLIE